MQAEQDMRMHLDALIGRGFWPGVMTLGWIHHSFKNRSDRLQSNFV